MSQGFVGMIFDSLMLSRSLAVTKKRLGHVKGAHAASRHRPRPPAPPPCDTQHVALWRPL